METPLTQHHAIRVTWLGKEVEYDAGMAVMRRAMDEVAEAGAELLLLEHAATITVTRQGGLQHLKVAPEDLLDEGIALVETDRGGDVTFHGPGQLVGYPVVRLREGDDGRADLVSYLRALERGLIDACARLGVEGCHRKEGMTGVWVASDPRMPAATWPDDDHAAKLVAIGVGVRRGVTRHGFALNVTTDLERFTRRIVPCGLHGRPVTSLERLLGPGALPDEETLRRVVAESVARALGVAAVFEPIPTSGEGRPRTEEQPKDGAFHG